MTIYHISGHVDITMEEFFTHYTPLLEKAVNEPGSYFVVGDAKGTDLYAQAYLLGAFGKDTDRVTVYHMQEAPRFNYGGFKTKGGFKSDEDRDSAMTRASTVDIAWVRPGREKSGTSKNLARRKNSLLN